MEIGQKIKVIRKSRGLTQNELALKANISRSYLGDLEGGRYNPSVDTLKAIAGALNTDISELLDDNENISNPDIRLIARAGKKLNCEQAAALRKYAEFMFPEAFNEN